MGHSNTRRNGERGQALVEAALVIPVLLLVAFGVVMAGRISHAKVAVQAIAREASHQDGDEDDHLAALLAVETPCQCVHCSTASRLR